MNYPVGLLTIDEIMLSGICSSTTNTSSYLADGSKWWTMSPSSYYITSSNIFSKVEKSTAANSSSQDNQNGLRPSIALKIGAEITSGDGTVNSPYVIKN